VEENDPVLQMRGVGKEIWADEGGDGFVARERAIQRPIAIQLACGRQPK
jgi:hypothetical protein